MMSSLSQSSQTNRPKVIAAVPCFNTEPFIAEVVSRARKYVDQVIVINDGSHDSTAKAAEAVGVLVINHDGNRGYGEAVKSCFEAAKANGADILVILDGDGQHNPDEIPKLVAFLTDNGADIVIGSRFMDSQTDMPGYRRFGIKIITFLLNFGYREKLQDAQSGFRAYSKQALNTISGTESGMGISVEILIKARTNNLKIGEVCISCQYHLSSSAMNPVIHGLTVAYSVVKLRLKELVDGTVRGVR
ncbi:glycosyltransferase family 2 protein [Chloroflexota bacterium]